MQWIGKSVAQTRADTRIVASNVLLCLKRNETVRDISDVTWGSKTSEN